MTSVMRLAKARQTVRTINDETLKWLVSDDTGTSSQTLCAMFFDIPVTGNNNHPCDTSDFGRCSRFLRTLNPMEQNEALLKVSKLSLEWKALADNWYLLNSITDNEYLYREMKKALKSARC